MIQKMKKNPKIWMILFLGLITLGGGVVFLKNSFAVVEPIKSVTITSKNASYANKEPGSWNVVKSAKWIEKGKAQITFDVDTVVKTETTNTDIILVLDVSGSMDGEKLTRVKEDATDLVETLLSDNQNKVALISFESNSRIIENLTNDKEKMVEQINNLTTTGCTNYYQAFKNVEEILKNYQKQEDREMIVLFLTDGYPNEETPNEIGEYEYLKSEYPYITINGIQYEMGEDVLDPIKRVSDNQFIADMNNLNNVLFEASVVPMEYSNITITDYINDEYFNIESIDEVYTSVGKAKLEYEKGIPKVIWNINNFKSGRKATMTINVTLKGKVSEDDLYPTNKKEVIESSITDNKDEKVTSTETPILANNYIVSYEANAPEGCSVENVPAQEKHLVFDKVDISNQEPTCEGYQFKGWEIITKDVKKVNQDTFIMPEKEVIIRATWSSLKLAKSMDGKVAEKVQSVMKKRYSSASTEAFWKYKDNITSIEFEDWIHVPSETPSDRKWDVSAAKNGSVVAYIEPDSEGSSTYKLHIQGEEKVIANSDSSYLFYGFGKLATIDGLEYFDTSNVTDMSSMFSICRSLISLDLSNFDTSKVTDMSSMFVGYSGSQPLDLSSFDTSSVTDMSYMFSSYSSSQSLDLSSFDTSSVTDMSYMFSSYSSSQSLDLSNFNTSKVTNMFAMFANYSSSQPLNLSHFDTSNVTNMSAMFSNYSSDQSLDLSNFDTSKVTSMSQMFSEYNSSQLLDLSSFNTSSVTDMSYMFSSYSSSQPLDLSHFDTSKVTIMWRMFWNCKSLSLDVSHFDISNVTNISQMFDGCSSLTSLDISSFNTAKVINMSYLFKDCSSLTSLNLSHFDTSSVTDMSYMFSGCKNLTSLDLSNFDTSQVTNMSYMLYRCTSLTSLDLSHFNTSNVTNMSNMFYYCSSLTSLDVSHFDTSNVTYISRMFCGCTGLSSLDVSKFNTSNVKNMSEVFASCTKLTGLDVSNFDTSKVTDMSGMFSNCSNLTVLDLSNFNTSNVTQMREMFNDCRNLTSLNLSNFDFSKINVADWNSTFNMFYYINRNCLITVKDEETKVWVLARRSNLTNVVVKSA